jgi:hypothetical protein
MSQDDTLTYTLSTRCAPWLDQTVNQVLDFEMGLMRQAVGMALGLIMPQSGTASQLKTRIAQVLNQHNLQAGFAMKCLETCTVSKLEDSDKTLVSMSKTRHSLSNLRGHS